MSLRVLAINLRVSDSSDDPQICMSRKTDWANPADGVCYGLGQRMLATDEEDHPLLQIRRISLESMA